MTDALSESFCERCGTRYEFAAPARLGPLRRTRGLLSGLKTYLTSQEALADAVGDAMRGETDAIAARQLTAFHDTFNFCLTCRQYACTTCWNSDAGRCRTCEPIPGQAEVVRAPEAAYRAEALTVSEPAAVPDEGAWPVADLSEPAPEPVPEPMLAVAEPEPLPEPTPVVEPMEEPAVAPMLAAAEPREPEPATTEVAATSEEVVEPQPVTFEVEIEAETVPASTPEPMPEPRPSLPPPPAVERPELAAHRAKLDLLGIGGHDAGAGASDRRVLPYRSRGAAAHPGEAPGVAALSTGPVVSVWDASAREVSQASGANVTACGNCALSLSVSARFCRRCGTPQARSA
ncbi:MAG TPA: hypothetical protein VJA85_03995 [Candidatus Limnocylindria bacterium]|nr:hypothetical protein [Candidatus Limnocylindria bacterium]